MAGWKWWFDFLWPIFLAVPGVIAFVWSWRDRLDKARAESPFGEWLFEREPRENGWYATQISIKNRWDEPLYAGHIEVQGIQGTLIALTQRSSGEVAPDTTGAASQHMVDWTFWSSTRTGTNPTSGSTILYVKPPKERHSGNAQSGTGETSSAERMSRLTLAITVSSPSNRRMKIIAKHKWSSKPLIRRAMPAAASDKVS